MESGLCRFVAAFVPLSPRYRGEVGTGFIVKTTKKNGIICRLFGVSYNPEDAKNDSKLTGPALLVKPTSQGLVQSAR